MHNDLLPQPAHQKGLRLEIFSLHFVCVSVLMVFVVVEAGSRDGCVRLWKCVNDCRKLEPLATIPVVRHSCICVLYTITRRLYLIQSLNFCEIICADFVVFKNNICVSGNPFGSNTFLAGYHKQTSIRSQLGKQNGVFSAWFKTTITTLFYITSYNSFAPSPQYTLDPSTVTCKQLMMLFALFIREIRRSLTFRDIFTL